MIVIFDFWNKLKKFGIKDVNLVILNSNALYP